MKKTRERKKRKRTPSEIGYFKKLESFVAKTSRATLTRHHVFSLCVKASLAKCFEFNLLVRNDSKNENAFFAMSSLRGICEDLIVLRYLKSIPATDREALLRALISNETANKVKLQHEFFKAFRPQQPVLYSNNVDADIQTSEAAAQTIWHQHGWPNLNRGTLPPTRQIAEKQSLVQLTILYDYLYRLTSNSVHFNVQSLLRSGWGTNPNDFHFSTKHFSSYFLSYCKTYGAFMFCLYFEFFRSVLKPTSKEMLLVDQIRSHLLNSARWPEMVTFEEMNIKAPDYMSVPSRVLSALQATTRKRLISSSADYRNKRSAERRFAKQVFKIIAAALPSKSTREDSLRKVTRALRGAASKAKTNPLKSK